jgi:phosphohistidine phosphatase
MQVYLLRHGIAEDAKAGQNDVDRALTHEGRQKLRDVLRTAAHADVSPTLILTSPLKRALQTAEIAKEVLGYKSELVKTKALTPGSPVEAVWDEIRIHRDEAQLLLVGHDPQFTNLGGYLLGAPSLQIDFKKGAILRADFDNFPAQPRGILRWYLTAKLAVQQSSNSKKS